MDKTALIKAINTIAMEKNIDSQAIVNSIINAFKKIYERKFNADGELIVELNPTNGTLNLFEKYLVVSKVEDDHQEISLQEAQKLEPAIQIGSEIKIPFKSEKFNRIAINMVSQLIRQAINEAERDSIVQKYKSSEGEIMTGKVSQVFDRYILVELENTHAMIPKKNLILDEHFEINDTISFLASDVSMNNKSGQIIGSRTSNQFLEKLMKIEISEIQEKIVTVKSVVRYPGIRAKVAVYSEDPNVDPVGACVGIRGARINNVSADLNNERIDVILWSSNNILFIINAFKPVKIVSVQLFALPKTNYSVLDDDGNPTITEKHEAFVIIPHDQLSLAFGKQGSTIRLVSHLTQWRINVISYQQAKWNNLDFPINGNIPEEHLADINLTKPDKNKGKVKDYSKLVAKYNEYNTYAKPANDEGIRVVQFPDRYQDEKQQKTA